MMSRPTGRSFLGVVRARATRPSRARALPDTGGRLRARRAPHRGHPAGLGDRGAAGGRRGGSARHRDFGAAEVRLLSALPVLDRLQDRPSVLPRTARKRALPGRAHGDPVRHRPRVCVRHLSCARVRRRHRRGPDRRRAHRVCDGGDGRRGAGAPRPRRGDEADAHDARHRRVRRQLPGRADLHHLRALAARPAHPARRPRRRVPEARAGDGPGARGGRGGVGLLPAHHARLRDPQRIRRPQRRRPRGVLRRRARVRRARPPGQAAARRRAVVAAAPRGPRGALGQARDPGG